jgi:hypothetical protein
MGKSFLLIILALCSVSLARTIELAPGESVNRGPDKIMCKSQSEDVSKDEGRIALCVCESENEGYRFNDPSGRPVYSYNLYLQVRNYEGKLLSKTHIYKFWHYSQDCEKARADCK